MKQKLNSEMHNENGVEIITNETEKNVVLTECADIGKLKRKRYLHNYHLKNRDRIHAQKRGYYQIHKLRIRLKNRRNSGYRNQYSKSYYRRNKTKLNDYRKKYLGRRYKTDTLFKIKHLLRGRIGELCSGRGFVKSKRTLQLLGCDLVMFKTYMETLFKPGMNWSNHGKWGWHIDHIIPLVHAKNQEELEALCYYKNLQPLWWYDNLSKSGSVPFTNKKV